MALIMDYWGLDGIIILTIIIITAYLYMTRNFKYWKNRGVLEITPTPFVGNFMECLLLKKAAAYFLKELYDHAKGEPYIGFYILDKPVLLLRDREIIKNILIKDFNTFCDRYTKGDPKDRIGYANLFFIKNPAWKIIRTKLTPFFTSGKLKKMFGLMLECGNHLDEYLDSLKLDGKGQIIDVKDISSKLTMDVISSTAYGLDVNTFKDSNLNFQKYGKMIFKNNYVRALEMLAIFFLPDIVRIARLKVFGAETTVFLRKLFWEVITKRMDSGEKRHDLIDILIELKKNSHDDRIEDFVLGTLSVITFFTLCAGIPSSARPFTKINNAAVFLACCSNESITIFLPNEFDGDDLMAQAASFFSAGFDTSSVPVAFTLYELALHPDIQNTLRKEMHQALHNSDGKVTYDMIISLPYMDMVILETLRKYPPLGYLNRMAMQTYKVPKFNLVIEKGTPIYIPMLGLHYDPEYFPNPEKFDPERFSEENKCNMPSCIYFPFGDGPHACIGTRFGLLLIKLTLIKILNKYEVTPCEKTMMPMIIDSAMAMTAPLNGIIYLNMRKANIVNN